MYNEVILFLGMKTVLLILIYCFDVRSVYLTWIVVDDGNVNVIGIRDIKYKGELKSFTSSFL